MNKKIIIIVLLAIFLMATISSTSVVAKNSSEDAGLALVSSEISIELDSQLDKPIATSGTKTIDITVKYRLDIDDLAARLFFNRRIGRFLLFGFGYILKIKGEPSVEIDLSVECPDWCTATIEPSNVTTEISNVFKEAESVQLTISVNESAPALEPGDIIITAESKAIWSIGGSTNKTTISVMAAYDSALEINTTLIREISPANETVIPIDITNNGNGETTVQVSLESYPENWNVSFDEENITIDSGAIKQVNLIVKPVKTFENETIQLKFTPVSTSDEDVSEIYLQGEVVSLSLTLLNDGSLKDEGDFPVFELAVILVIIIAAIVIVTLFLKRKKD